MEKPHELFPWIRPYPETETAAPPVIGNTRSVKPWKKLMPIAIVAVALALLWTTRGAGAPAAGNFTPSIDALVPLVAQNQGDEVQIETLKAVPIDKSQLTKLQVLEIVRAEDIQNLRGRLRAKHDLPPNRPLFWRDLDIVRVPVPGSGLPSSPLVLTPKETHE
ncbi:MAG: hypothetical protein JST16_09620 [Bdellovibrionales bacterium]|nr:hypothetical protein [Bdellovibrionales bacterium]